MKEEKVLQVEVMSQFVGEINFSDKEAIWGATLPAGLGWGS